MTILSKTALIAALALAFAAGWWTAGPSLVHAQDTPAQLEVRTIAAESALIVHYPASKKAYVYQSPFVGSPNILCTYSFTFGGPGEPVTRDQCKQ